MNEFSPVSPHICVTLVYGAVNHYRAPLLTTVLKIVCHHINLSAGLWDDKSLASLLVQAQGKVIITANKQRHCMFDCFQSLTWQPRQCVTVRGFIRSSGGDCGKRLSRFVPALLSAGFISPVNIFSFVFFCAADVIWNRALWHWICAVPPVMWRHIGRKQQAGWLAEILCL